MTKLESKRLDLKEEFEIIERESSAFLLKLRKKEVPANEETRAKLERWEKEMIRLEGEIGAIQRQQDAEEIEALTGNLGTQRDRIAAGGTNPFDHGTRAEGREHIEARTIQKLFCRDRPQQFDRAGFRDADEYFRVWASGKYDPRLDARGTAAWEKIDSEGGFMVIPQQFAAEILDGSLESELIRPRANIKPMTSQTAKVPGFDSANHSNGQLFGGFTAVWMAESGTQTRQKAKLRMITLEAKKLGIFTAMSNELRADSDFGTQISRALRLAVGFQLDYSFIHGDGAGKPLGLLNDPAKIVVSAEGGQAVDTIVYDNTIKMLARLHPGLDRGAVWIANPTTKPQLLTMTVPVGTGGSFVPAVRESNGRMTLHGHEILFSEKVPTIGDEGDLILTNLSQYQIGQRQDVQLAGTNAAGWFEDEFDIRALVRFDGQGRWNSPVTPVHGDTLSWIITLAPR